MKKRSVTNQEVSMATPPENVRIPLDALGRRYADLLVINAHLNHQTTPNVTAQAIACIKQSLKGMQQWIKDGIQYEADRDGISFDEAWRRALGEVGTGELKLTEVAQSVGCEDGAALLGAIARGEVVVSKVN